MRLLFVIILSVSLLFLQNCSGKKDEPRNAGSSESTHAMGPKPRIYSLVYKAGGEWKITVMLNGATILNADHGGGFQPIVFFMVDGRNVLQIRVEQMRDPQPFDEPAQITIGWYTEGETDFAARPVDMKINLEHAGYIKESVIHFDASIPVKWTWQSGETIKELTDEDKNTIYDEIKQVYDAVCSKNIDALLNLASVGISNEARYRGTDVANVATAYRKICESLFSDPNFSPALREREGVEIEGIGGQLILVGGKRDSDGFLTYLIRVTDVQAGETHTSYAYHQMGFAKINGQWKIMFIQ